MVSTVGPIRFELLRFDPVTTLNPSSSVSFHVQLHSFSNVHFTPRTSSVSGESIIWFSFWK